MLRDPMRRCSLYMRSRLYNLMVRLPWSYLKQRLGVSVGCPRPRSDTRNDNRIIRQPSTPNHGREPNTLPPRTIADSPRRPFLAAYISQPSLNSSSRLPWQGTEKPMHSKSSSTPHNYRIGRGRTQAINGLKSGPSWWSKYEIHLLESCIDRYRGQKPMISGEGGRLVRQHQSTQLHRSAILANVKAAATVSKDRNHESARSRSCSKSWEKLRSHNTRLRQETRSGLKRLGGRTRAWTRRSTFEGARRYLSRHLRVYRWRAGTAAKEGYVEQARRVIGMIKQSES